MGKEPRPEVDESHMTNNAPSAEISPDTDTSNDRHLAQAYILAIPFGWLGAHHFYLRRPCWGVLYLFTIGLFGVGYVVDLFRMYWLVRRANQDFKERHVHDKIQKKTVGEAYLLWFPCGLFGFHHFYLGNIGWGLAYLFSMGFLGLGWIIDGICMCILVSEYNKHQEYKHKCPQEDSAIIHNDAVPCPRSLVTAYRLCLFPVTGLFGVHHYYLGRTAYGIFYSFTLGGLGLPWIVDWFRLSILVKDANNRRLEHRGFRERRLDDCYLAAIPCGLFGAHHFYLRNVGWGFLYLFTIGCLGIGWLVDLVRMPKLLKQHKDQMERSRRDNSGEAGGGAVTDYGTHQIGTGGVYVVPPGHVGPGYPGPALPTGGNAPTPTSYPDKADGLPGQPPQYIPPPGYDESGMSSFSSITSSNVDGLPSYQDALRDSLQNQSNMAAVNAMPSAPHTAAGNPK